MVGLCVLCLKSTNKECDKKYKLFMDLLKMLSLDPWWKTDKPTLCSNCNVIVVKALDFKSNCVNTEKTLSPFIRKNAKVDLCSVYLKKLKTKDASRPWSIMKICRLCIKLIEKSDSYLLDFLEYSHLEDIFKKYLPEMELSKFEEPLICEQCVDNFQNFADFIISCMDTKNKIKKFCEASHISVTKQVNLKEVLRHSMKDILGGDVCYKLERRHRSEEPLLLISHIKEESDSNLDVDVEELGDTSDLLEVQLRTKTIVPVQNITITNYSLETKTGEKKCKHCDYKTNHNLLRHVKRKHADIYNFPVFKCKVCDYKTTDTTYLKRHSLSHPELSNDEILQCEKCKFQTLNKKVFKKHKLTHMPSKVLPVFKCEICSFSTKYKGGLTQHLRIHMDRSKIAIYKCDLKGCNYSTIEKSYLTKHKNRHTTPCLDKVETIYCQECSFKTGYKKHMRTHIQHHKKGTIDMSLLRCDHNYCKYKTRIEEKLDEHYVKQHKRNSSRLKKK